MERPHSHLAVDAPPAEARGYAGVDTPDRRSPVLTGLAASPGIQIGPARLLKSPEDWRRVEVGDVIVIDTAHPRWARALAKAGACISDSGGGLSALATTAREFRIPAVLGTRTATRVIHDGQIISVDGDAGTVHNRPLD